MRCLSRNTAESCGFPHLIVRRPPLPLHAGLPAVALFSSKSDLLPADLASWEKRSGKGNDESRSYAVDRDAVKAKVGGILRRSPVLFGDWLARPHDSNAMVGESVVHIRNIDLRHVARGAILRVLRARPAGMIFSRFRIGRIDVARQAFLIVAPSIL